ncbi:MAG: hypothetical protein RLZZ202_1311, partial [Pseudomonadota bacterium]
AQGFTQKAQQISEKIFANDGLSIPIATTPTVSPLAKGLDRTLVLGGGGEYYIAWYCGFFHGLLEAGLDMASLSQMVVGTSAGSYMGSSLLSDGFLWRVPQDLCQARTDNESQYKSAQSHGN